MNLILGADLLANPHREILERVRAVAPSPRIAWLGADTAHGQAAFAAEAAQLRASGFDVVEYCDIDAERDEVQLAYLHEYQVIYLADGDPLRFRYNLLRSGTAGRLRQCLQAGRLVMASGGGMLTLTVNVSTWRLSSESLDEVLASRSRYGAIEAVKYEVLFGIDGATAATKERIRRYSEHLEHDVLLLADDAAILARSEQEFDHVGTVTRCRKGIAEICPGGMA